MELWFNLMILNVTFHSFFSQICFVVSDGVFHIQFLFDKITEI